MFQLQGTQIAYDEAPVLHDINLNIAAGEQVALIGPSGAGKTTLLRHLYQQQPKQVSLIHQDYALVQSLTVFHNVWIGRLDRTPLLRNLRNLIKPHDQDLSAVCCLLKNLGLDHKCHARVKTLSGGQQQRTAIARALFRGDQVILADEPVSSVDPEQARHILDHLKAQVPTLVVSLHSVQLALHSFERIIALRAGRIAYDGPSQELDPDRLHAIFQPC